MSTAVPRILLFCILILVGTRDLAASAPLRYGVVLLLALLACRSHATRKGLAAELTRRWPLTAFLGLALGSAAWSVDPSASREQALGFAVLALLGLSLTTISDPLGLLRQALVARLAFNAVYLWGVYPHGRVSLELHLNYLALQAVVLATLGLAGSDRRWSWLGVALAVGIAVHADSLTSLVALPVILVVWWWRTRRASRLVVGLSLTLVASAFLAAVLTDPTLTGRTEIWLYLTEVYRERPWLGHGFGQTDLSWRLPFHCHNQLLTLLLGVGAVGCWLFLTDALLAFRASLMHADGQWATVYLAFLAVAGLTEQVPFEAPSLFFALYVFAGSATEATGERATLLRET